MIEPRFLHPRDAGETFEMAVAPHHRAPLSRPAGSEPVDEPLPAGVRRRR